MLHIAYIKIHQLILIAVCVLCIVFINYHYVLASFIEIQQRFILDFNTDWLIDTSPARREFNSLMSEALAPLFNSILSFLGVNIQDVSQYVANNQNGRKKRAIERWDKTESKSWLCFVKMM